MRNEKGQFVKGIIPWTKGRSGLIAWNKGLKGFKHSGSFQKGHPRYKKTTKGDFQKGFIPWNKGVKGIMKANSGSFKKGIIPWNKGKKQENKIDKRILVNCKKCGKEFKAKPYVLKQGGGKFCSKQCSSIFSKGHIPWNKGIPHTEKTKEKLRKANKGKAPPNKNITLIKKVCIYCKKEFVFPYWKMKNRKYCSFKCWTKEGKNNFQQGKGNINWNNGTSFEPYGLEFNEDLKEVIRNRDRRKCMLCGKTELENKKKLAIHHIDYNKRNNNPNNLISLCIDCHQKTNYNRNYWTDYFQKYESIKS